MSRAVLDGLTLAYECAGAGSPIVFIHGALIADAFRPLLAELALTNFAAEHSQDRLRDSLRLILVERPRSQTGDLLLEPCRGVHDGLREGTWQHAIKVGAVVCSEPRLQEVVDNDFGALSSRALLTLR